MKLCQFISVVALFAQSNSCTLIAATPVLSGPLEHLKVVLGPLDQSGQVRDIVRSETPSGCRIGYTISNDPSTAKAHAYIDGKITVGYDDIGSHGGIQFSPDGGHVVFTNTKNGKQRVVIDGISGPLFDQIDPGQGPFFTIDGKHSIYVGRTISGKTNTWQAVFDGVLGPAYDHPIFVNGIVNWPPLGRHGEVASQPGACIQNGNSPSPHPERIVYSAQNGAKRLLVVDGVPGQEFDQVSDLTFGVDEAHFAYAGYTGSRCVVVLDGVQGPEFSRVGKLTFSPDGKHLAYIAKRINDQKCPVIDQVLGADFTDIKDDHIEFSPDSRHFMFNGFDGESLKTMVDGKPVLPAAYDYSSDGMHSFSATAVSIVQDGISWQHFDGRIDYGPKFSPDFRHLACVVSTSGAAGEQPQQYLILDGTTGPKFPLGKFHEPYAHALTFSPDSRHVAYVALEEKVAQVVLDNKAGPQFDSILSHFPIFSPDGSHLAYAAKRGNLWQVVVDQTAGPQLKALDEESVIFSATGQECAYIGMTGYQQQVFVNGLGGPKFDEIRHGLPLIGVGGEHLAYAARTGNIWRVVIDGVSGPELSGIGEHAPFFSSNSQHVVYVAQKENKERVMIDGMAGPEFSQVIAGPVECNDGRLEYLALEDSGHGSNLVRVVVPGFAPPKT